MDRRHSPLAVIPARANSSRFPNKVIAKIHDKPMVQYVWEAACGAAKVGQCIIATDDEGVAKITRGFGAETWLTPAELPSGTDRVAKVASEFGGEFIVNLQADEPLITSAAIDSLIEALEADPLLDMATLAVRRNSPQDLNDPNIVKLVMSPERVALYFSRQPIASGPDGEFYKHIGIYAFRRRALEKFCQLPVSALERVERLEQLRGLENGFRIGVREVGQDTIAVDIPEDLRKVESFLSNPGSICIK